MLDRTQLAGLLALGAWFIAMATGGVVAHLAGAPSTLLFCFIAAFVPYAWLVTQEKALPPKELAVLAGGVGLIFLTAPAGFSDDLYRYLWDAHVLWGGEDPYRYAPADPALLSHRDVLWRQINNPEIPTIYPPVAQLVFAIADALAHSPWSVRLVMLLGHLCVIPLLVRIGPRWAATAWALNPLALSESALGGHVDVLVGLALLAFVMALLRGRVGWAIAFAGLASGLKLVGFVLAPLVGHRSRKAIALALVLAALPVLPLLSAGSGSDAVGGLGQYARRWRGNDGLYGVVEGGVASALTSAAGVSPGRVRFEEYRPLFERLQGTALDPRASFLPEKKPIWDVAEFETHVLAAVTTRGLVAFAVGLLAFFLGVFRAEPLRAARVVLYAVLLLAPTIHPWYLLWLLPLELAAGGMGAIVWSVAIFAAYAPLDGWLVQHEWNAVIAHSGLWQQGIVLLVVLIELLLPRRAPTRESEARNVSVDRELSPKVI
ncbi:MAG: glycosyltransferase family 87 protein [Myxococcota bacterium]